MGIVKNKTPLLAGTIGTIIEMYDMAAYGYMAVFIASNFFANTTPSRALINTFAVFFLGFVTRPMGATLFGWVGDFIGRKPALLISIALMSIATGIIGFLPTYHQIGSIAFIMLIIARLFQGISVGGEYIGSIVYLYEAAPEGKKTFFSSFAMMGCSLGVLIASGVAFFVTKIFTPHQMLAFGWRIPFLLALVGGLGGFLIRRQINETSDFLKTKEASTPAINVPLQKDKVLRPFVLSLLLTCLGTMTTYVVYVYTPTYLHAYHGLPLKSVLLINTLATVLLTLLLPLCGYFADKIKKNRMLYWGLGGLTILLIPYIAALSSNNLKLIALAQFTITLPAACYFSSGLMLIVKLFKTKVRYRLASISYNLSAALFGGTVPLLCSWLISKTGSFLLLGVAFALLSVLTGVCLVDAHKRDIVQTALA